MPWEIIYRGRRGPTRVFRETYGEDGAQIEEHLLFPAPDNLWEGDLAEKPSSDRLADAQIYDWGSAAPSDKVTNLARGILWNYRRDTDYIRRCEPMLRNILINASRKGLDSIDATDIDFPRDGGFLITGTGLDQVCS